MSRVIGKIIVLALVGAAFLTGLLGAVYFSLRSPEVAVPEVVGKNQTAGREMLEDAGLDLRVRASRFAPNARPDTILDQSPRPGDVIKVGQTVAVVVARAEARDGEAVATTGAPRAGNENAADGESAENENSRGATNTSRDEPANRNANRNANRASGGRSPRNSNRNGNANTNGNINANNNANRANRNAGNLNSGNANRATPNVTRTPGVNRNTAPAANRNTAPVVNRNTNQTRSRTTTNANRP